MSSGASTLSARMTPAGPIEPGGQAPPQMRFQRPSLPAAAAIDGYLELSRRERWFSNGGPCWRLLRDRLSDRVGAYCVPVASGTVGLLAAIAATLVEDSRGGGAATALLPSFTFPATAQAATWAGLRPLLLDVDPTAWHLSCDQLEAELAERGREVALVLAVCSFGTPPPPEVRERWERACRAADVALIVDSAAGFGATAADRTPIGAQGDIEVVSFHATKPFAIGEGGAVFTRDAGLRDRIERTINFGFDRSGAVTLARGLNGKMSELHAATALAVLDELDTILAARREAAAAVRAQVGATVVWQEGSERSTWQFVPVAFADMGERVVAQERCRGVVETRTYYEPLHGMPVYRDLPRAASGLTQTERLAARLLCLPMANDLDVSEIDQIARAIRGDSDG
jgi:dTDP-4-amino-4,6-dideoxygalactose transaminase